MCGVEPENSTSDEITKSRWLDLAEPQGKAASQGVNRSGQRDFFVFLSGNGVLRAFDSLGLTLVGSGDSISLSVDTIKKATDISTARPGR